MRLPRFKISWIMAFVALVAIDLAVVRLVAPFRRPDVGDRHTTAVIDALAYGVLPMANILAIGLLIAYRQPERRPFLWGFEAFGMIALCLYIAISLKFTEEWIHPYLGLVLKPLWPKMQPLTNAKIIAFSLIPLILLGMPQVAFAVMGGYLSRKLIGTAQRG
jgi:hypothetical protein